MSTLRLTTLATIVAAAVFGAESTTVPMLIEADWLNAHLNDRDLVLFHVGPKDGYDQAHIPGARHLTLDDITRAKNPTELTLELATPQELRAKLESFGVSDSSHIVVYFGVKPAFQSATRVIFTLDYLGLGGRASLLNGGFPAWTAAGKPLTALAPAAPSKPGKLSAKPTRDLVVDAAFVSSIDQRKDQKLIDARLPNFYNGANATYEKNGHIPGAVNLPFAELLDDNLMLDRERAAKLLSAAGVKKGDTAVVYCHIGQQATAVIFAARIAGYPAKLYDGSFEDWAKNARGPVEK